MKMRKGEINRGRKGKNPINMMTLHEKNRLNGTNLNKYMAGDHTFYLILYSHKIFLLEEMWSKC